MDIYTIIKIAGTIVSTLAITATGIWWFIKLGANTLADTYKNKINHEFGKKLEDYKSQLEVLKASTLKYRDKQFELYIDLWKNLQDLQFATNDLWERANLPNLKKFEIALKKTHRQIETTSILLEEHHYRELEQIIIYLQQFNTGKGNLIAARRDTASDDEINRLVDHNRDKMKRCVTIVKSMKPSIKEILIGKEI
jgi:hypothetical protein